MYLLAPTGRASRICWRPWRFFAHRPWVSAMRWSSAPEVRTGFCFMARRIPRRAFLRVRAIPSATSKPCCRWLDIAKEGGKIFEEEIEWAKNDASLDDLESQLRDKECAYLRDAVRRGEMTEEDAQDAQDALPSPKQQIENWRIYHLHDTSATAAVKSNCNVDDNRYLREDAANLAAYLYWLQQKQP